MPFWQNWLTIFLILKKAAKAEKQSLLQVESKILKEDFDLNLNKEGRAEKVKRVNKPMTMRKMTTMMMLNFWKSQKRR